VNTLIIIA